MIKKIFIAIFLVVTLNANNYTYLLDEYKKDTELEAKIVLKIARDILTTTPVHLYIPNMKPLDYEVYSSSVKLVRTCEKANFVFVKYGKSFQCKKNKNIFVLTNNYRQLLTNHSFIGAFFWSKSRPNIVLVKNRLSKNAIVLPKEYERYIEDLH
ncbi:MAG: hypothetical protein HWD90_06180 [Campylobacteraceae bacterium]|nr:hypothetical protein [Campylobacteraceae bacterium]